MWQEPPLDIFIRIVEKCGRTLHLRGLLSLQMVSKYWKATVSEYNGHVELHINQSADIFRLCHTLPSMSDLMVSACTFNVDLSPLSACSRLTSLSIDHAGSQYDIKEAETNQLLDLTSLPSSLEDLTVFKFQLDPARLTNIACCKLRKLILIWTDNTVAETVQLLQLLPELEVSFSFHITMLLMLNEQTIHSVEYAPCSI